MLDQDHLDQNRGIGKPMLLAFGLIVLGCLALLVDTEVTRLRQSDFLAGDFRRIIRLSEIFAHGFGIAVTIYLLWVLAPDRRKMIPRLAACAILPGILVQCIKLFVGRYRPGHFYPEFTDQVSTTWIGVVPNGQLNFEYVSQSFPSAHAATAVGFAIGLTWLFPKCRNLFVTLATLATLQRVMAGAHWLSDVCFGAAVSVIVCSIVFRFRAVNGAFCRLETQDRRLPELESQLAETNKHAGKAA